jgi:hypothetical protein
MAPDLATFGTGDRDAWMAALSGVVQYDFYHLPEYHRIAENAGEGRAELLVYRDGEYLIALPLLVRRCDTVEGLGGVTALDATSVYGYAGPVSSHRHLPAPVIADFQTALFDSLSSRGVVALFSRLHPLIEQSAIVVGLGESDPRGTTVSIDLTLSEEAQIAEVRHNHRRDIKKLRALGASCEMDAGPSLDDFIPIYHETMRRLGAASHYFFDQAYFSQLAALRGTYVHEFSCHLAGEVIASGLFFACDGIIQYHLGATRTEFVGSNPMKLIFDTVRRWGLDSGMRIFHLGGGLGGQEDSLFGFKAGFSHRRHDYATWRWILDPQRFDAMTATKARWNAAHGVEVASPDYFPAYRS